MFSGSFWRAITCTELLFQLIVILLIIKINYLLLILIIIILQKSKFEKYKEIKKFTINFGVVFSKRLFFKGHAFAISQHENWVIKICF